jgi:hypothetical protein
MTHPMRTMVLVVGLAATGVAAAHGQAPLGPAKSDGPVILQSTGGFIQGKFGEKDDTFELGYVSRLDKRIADIRRKQRAGTDAGSRIHHVGLIGFDLQGTPSNGTASIFSGDRLTTGGQVTLTLGRAFIASSLPSYLDVVGQGNANLLDIIECNLDARDLTVLKGARENLTKVTDRLSKLAQDASQSSNGDPSFSLLFNEARELQEKFDSRIAAFHEPTKSDNPPTAPTSITVEPLHGKLCVKWVADKTAKKFRVTRKNLSSQEEDTREVYAPCFIDPDAQPGQAYQYVVVSVNDKGDSPQATKDVTVPPKPATGKSKGGPGFDMAHLKISAKASKSTLFDALKPFSDQFSKKSFAGFGVELGYQANYGGAIPYIWGISGGVARTNNADTLTSVEATDQQMITGPDGTQRTITTTRKGLKGDYKEETAGTLKFDLIIYPDLLSASANGSNPRGSVALDLFARTAFASETKIIAGLGVYLTKPGNPLKVYGGVNIYRDADRKLAVDLVAGFPF